MSPTLTHLALHVPDLDACIAFYETFCGMRVIHRRPGKGSQIVWMAEPGQEQRFIFVIMPGGQPRNLASDDYSHFGFALSSRAAVDDLARRAEAAGCLVWAPRGPGQAGGVIRPTPTTPRPPTAQVGRIPPWPFAPYEKRRAPIGDAAFFIGNGEAQ